MITVIHLLFNIRYSLIYWSRPYNLFNLFQLTEQIRFVYVRAQTTKHVQASSIACSSSAMLEQAQLDALDTSNVSSRVKPSGIWAYQWTTSCSVSVATEHRTP